MNELRQDIISGEWVIIAPGRAKRPHEFKKNESSAEPAPKNTCPFEDLTASGNEPIALYPSKAWKIAVIPNKFPILTNDPTCSVPRHKGPYTIMDGKGHHEILVTREHDKNFTKLERNEALEIFLVAKERYRVFDSDLCVKYVSFFHAWGPKAGASIYHPHYQMLGLPVIPPDVERSLTGSARYFKENGTCAHCMLIAYEKRMAKRIIYENEKAIAFAPFVSKQPYEVRIFPKKHDARFSHSGEADMLGVAAALREVLRKMEKKLGNPDYNFFLHSSPADEKSYPYYHWHIEVIPKISIFGGFEWETGMVVNSADPDDAAALLKE